MSKNTIPPLRVLHMSEETAARFEALRKSVGHISEQEFIQALIGIAEQSFEESKKIDRAYGRGKRAKRLIWIFYEDELRLREHKAANNILSDSEMFRRLLECVDGVLKFVPTKSEKPTRPPVRRKRPIRH